MTLLDIFKKCFKFLGVISKCTMLTNCKSNNASILFCYSNKKNKTLRLHTKAGQISTTLYTTKFSPCMSRKTSYNSIIRQFPNRKLNSDSVFFVYITDFTTPLLKISDFCCICWPV